jgi:hypothetical protein
VALLLRYSSGNIVLFEATGETGVILTNWHDFLTYNWYEQYEKIVYRKLHYDRPSEMLMDLELFIKVNRIFSLRFLGNSRKKIQDKNNEAVLQQQIKNS